MATNLKKQVLTDVYPGEGFTIPFERAVNGSISGWTLEFRIDLIETVHQTEEEILTKSGADIIVTSEGSAGTKATAQVSITPEESVLLDYTKTYTCSLWKTSPAPIENVAVCTLKPNKPRRPVA